MNFEYPNHLGDLIKNEAPRDTTELNFSIGNRSVMYVVLWMIKSIIILTKEVALIKQHTQGQNK